MKLTTITRKLVHIAQITTISHHRTSIDKTTYEENHQIHRKSHGKDLENENSSKQVTLEVYVVLQKWDFLISDANDCAED